MCVDLCLRFDTGGYLCVSLARFPVGYADGSLSVGYSCPDSSQVIWKERFTSRLYRRPDSSRLYKRIGLPVGYRE